MAIPTFTFLADGTSNPIVVRTYVGPYSRFEFTVFYYGGFGSGTVKLQASCDAGVTYVDIPNSSSTSATVMNMEIRATHIRAVLTGSTGPSLNVGIL